MNRSDEANGPKAGKPGRKPFRPGAGKPPLRKPLGQPVGKPLGQPAPKPAEPATGEALGAPVPKGLGRPVGKPLGRPTAVRVPRKAASPVATAPLPAPTLDPLAAAKLKWQPALRWCQKEQKEAQLTDPKVLTAVRAFHVKVQAVLEAPDGERFQEAQAEAVGLAREHQFLRWAPLPKPLPTP